MIPTREDEVLTLTYEVLLGEIVVADDSGVDLQEFIFTPANQGQFTVRLSALADNGETAVTEQTITVISNNSEATISGDNAGALTEDDAGDSGVLTVSDPDDGESVFQEQSETPGDFGDFSITAAGNWTYNLTADLQSMNLGDELTDSFNVTSFDGTATETVTITIDGLNDLATIGGELVGEFSEDETSTSGVLTVMDVDDGEGFIGEQTATTGTYGTFSIDAAGNWSYMRTVDLQSMNDGDLLTDSFDVTSADGATTETVTISINGLNDTASISGENAGAMTEDDMSVGGVLAVSDVDSGENVFQPQTGTSGSYGTFSIDAAGNWSYTRYGQPAVDERGDELTDSFAVTSADGTATETVTITINGLNDTATISGDNTGDMTEDERRRQRHPGGQRCGQRPKRLPAAEWHVGQLRHLQHRRSRKLELHP